MRRRRFSNFRRRGRRRVFRRTRYYPKRSRNFVKRTVMGMAETKQATFNINNTYTNQLTQWQLFPQIPQGSGDNQRIGNKVRGRWLTVNLTMRYQAGDNEDGLPVDCRLYIVWPKLTVSDSDAQVNLTNFPLFQLPDQDNFFYWKDYQFVIAPGNMAMERRSFKLKWYKRIPYQFEFRKQADTLPSKMPLMILVCNQRISVSSLAIGGYVKFSYKDI